MICMDGLILTDEQTQMAFMKQTLILESTITPK